MGKKFSEAFNYVKAALLFGLLLFLPLILSSCVSDKKFIYFPDATLEATPEGVGLPFEDLYIPTEDNVVINAWFIPHPAAKATLLWFHGNSGNLSDRVVQLYALHQALPVNIMMVDYREYGRSEGVVSEPGTYLDAEAVYDYLTQKKNTDKIIIYGQSLGSGVATELALRRNIDALVLEAPFLSIEAMAKVRYKWLPMSWLVTTKYDNLSKIAKIKTPILIFNGDHDDVVPAEQGRRLFASASGPKEFHNFVNYGHNNIYEAKDYGETLRNFLFKSETSSDTQNSLRDLNAMSMVPSSK